jgi:hypothetical protein
MLFMHGKTVDLWWLLCLRRIRETFGHAFVEKFDKCFWFSNFSSCEVKAITVDKNDNSGVPSQAKLENEEEIEVEKEVVDSAGALGFTKLLKRF